MHLNFSTWTQISEMIFWFYLFGWRDTREDHETGSRLTVVLSSLSSAQVFGELWRRSRRRLPSAGFFNMLRTAAFGHTMVWWSRMPPTLPERAIAFATRPTGHICMRNTRRRDGKKKQSRGTKPPQWLLIDHRFHFYSKLPEMTHGTVLISTNRLISIWEVSSARWKTFRR